MVDPLRLEQKNRQQAGGFVKAVLFVSAPPDRLRRGIKAAEEEQGGTNHAFESTKTGQIPPSVAGLATKTTGTAKGNSVEMTAKATDNQQAAQEMRRDRRFPVSQPAIITQPGHAEIACEIRDFCLGGLFLRFTSPEAAIASLARRADAEVEIVFTPASAGATQTFRVPAQLKRLSPQGIGVSFARQPVDACGRCRSCA